ncbi:hypothetical protein FB451DRAFT_1237253 [Mycena latifolia]|nr:hypothetical protein FB451DRAFT_1237253 [Mycena latifolia]
MDQTSAGNNLVSGIQDVSAFLPIIGTDQCERHVGEALEGGFLYAAATPLSMFGSLGIVKASAAILVASISPRFARMLADSGFKIEGSVAAMIGTSHTMSKGATSQSMKAQVNKNDEAENRGQKKDIPKYIAARKFEELLVEQHIETSQLELKFNYYSWNWQLCISTGLLSCLSITPYIRLIMDDHPPSKPFPAWAAPLMRIFGSAVSVVVAQMIIQIQMERILQMTLDETTADEQPSPISGSGSKVPLHDVEKGNDAAGSDQAQSLRDDSSQTTTEPSHPIATLFAQNKRNDMVAPPLPNNIPTRIRLILLQFLLFIGIVSTAIGYLSCFTVVQNATPRNTYIWLGLEIFLALLRIYIWALNPSYDEHTGLRLELRLPDNPERAPTLTTGRDVLPILEEHDPFVVRTDTHFLEYISPYTGPVERFNDPDNHVVIYYALAGYFSDTSESDEAKVLLTTVLDLESRSTFVLVHHCGTNHSFTNSLDPAATICAATSEIMQDTGIITVTCGLILHTKHGFTKTERFTAIDKHSRGIADRIGGIGRIIRLDVSWRLDSPTPVFDEAREPTAAPLTRLDKERLRKQRLADCWRRDFDQERDMHMRECMASVLDLEPALDVRGFAKLAVALEQLLSYECAFFEKELLVKTTPNDVTNHLFHEHARRLEVRVAGEARTEAFAKRISQYRQMVASPGVPGSELDSFSDDTLTQVLGAMDVDDETLKWLQARSCSEWWDVRRDDARSISAFWKLQVKKTETRLAMWKYSTSSNTGFAQAIFAEYPNARCANDPELLAIMATRGCSVLDFDGGNDAKSPVPLETITERDDPASVVSLLRCPTAWVAQLTEIAQSPHILAIDLPDSVGTELQTRLRERRDNWGKPLIQGGDRITSCFCFSSGFRATGCSMQILYDTQSMESQSTGFLLVKAAQAEKLQVTLWHRDPKESALRLSWRLQAGAFDELQIPESDEFRRDSFTVEVSSGGVHRIDITVIKPAGQNSEYELRKVWVSALS